MNSDVRPDLLEHHAVPRTGHRDDVGVPGDHGSTGAVAKRDLRAALINVEFPVALPPLTAAVIDDVDVERVERAVLGEQVAALTGERVDLAVECPVVVLTPRYARGCSQMH